MTLTHPLLNPNPTFHKLNRNPTRHLPRTEAPSLPVTLTQVGSLHASPDELLTAVTGSPLSPKPFLKYLRDKYAKLYELDL